MTEPLAPAVPVSSSYPQRLLFTVALLAVYALGHRLGMPWIDRAALLELRVRGELGSALALGIQPLIVGFLLVEVVSLITPAGRRLREIGLSGRLRLNRTALTVSLVLAAVQALGVALTMESFSTYGGAPAVSTPGYPFRFLLVVTLTAVTAALFALGQAISSYGVGNGFALMVLAESVLTIGPALVASLTSPDAPRYQLLVVLAILGLAAVIFRVFRSADDAWLPAFPQSLVPASAVLRLSPLLGWAVAVVVPVRDLLEPAFYLSHLLMVVLLSWLGFHLFSSRRRLQVNRTDPEATLDELAAALKPRAIGTTVLVTLGMAASLALQVFWPSRLASALGIAELVTGVAIGIDLWDQFRFERRVGATARLIQLDNVHFSCQLEERLQEEGVDALARGHLFRSLTFFFGALFKIDVLVAAPQLERAREILAQLELAREVQAF